MMDRAALHALDAAEIWFTVGRELACRRPAPMARLCLHSPGVSHDLSETASTILR